MRRPLPPAAVRYQLKAVPDLADGDVLVTNHPQAGGSHLPDITVITPGAAGHPKGGSAPLCACRPLTVPLRRLRTARVATGRAVFDGEQIVFFVASRGHHSDIGGIAPGSMPPLSKELYEEGACIKSFRLVRAGQWQQDGIVELLNAPGKLPGCAPTRNLKDVLSDLRAQVAANHRGIALVRELIAEYGLDVVHAYMHYIQETAEIAVRDMLRAVARRTGTNVRRLADALSRAMVRGGDAC